MTVASREFPPAPLPSKLASALVFVASGAVLVLEVAGLRLVGPYLGLTLQTNSAVIGVALAAVAYGAWTGGWLADRYDPRRLLAPALLGAAAATAVVLPVVRYAGDWLRGTDPVNILLLTVLTLFLPGALLSAVTPLVVKLQLGSLEQTGRVVGRLSGIGTVGGITATLVTGFVLVAALPTSAIVLGLAGLLALVGLGMLWYAGRAPAAGGPSWSGRWRALLALVGLGAAGLAATAPEACELETAYHCAVVTVDPGRPGGRTLWLNSAEHSYVDISDPTYLEFEYTRWIGALIEAMAPTGLALDAVHIGGGGGTMPGYLAARRPGSRSTVLEIDKELIALDRARLGLREGPALRVVTGDARVNLGALRPGSADLVIGDAFGHLAVPWHLTTREFVEEIRRVLRPGGVYALNLIDRPAGRFARAELATIAAVFGHVAVVAPAAAVAGGAGANWVLLASSGPLPVTALGEHLSRLAEPVPVLAGAEATALARNARVLTDDFAPVDQLVTGF